MSQNPLGLRDRDTPDTMDLVTLVRVNNKHLSSSTSLSIPISPIAEFDGFGPPRTPNSDPLVHYFYTGGYSTPACSPIENEPGTTRSINEFVFDILERP